MENNYTVYKHTTPNEKVYIGITCRAPQKRWENGSGYKDNDHFYRAIQKYGWENIKHEILFEGLTKEGAFKKEVELIAEYQSNNNEYGYNKSLGGDAGFRGLHHTEDAKQKIRESKKYISEETRQKLSEAGKRRQVSEETRRKISESNKGKRLSEESKRKMSEARKCNHLSEETKQKMSEAHKGKHLSEDAKRKISIANKGKTHGNGYISAETRQKLSNALKGKEAQNKKKVLCIETGIIYPSATKAAEELHISLSNISRACNGKSKSSGGYHWEYIA